MVISGKEVMIKTKVDSEIAHWLEKETEFRNKGNVTRKAMEFYYNYKFNRNYFLITIIQENFSKVKHFLRVIGSTRGK